MSSVGFRLREEIISWMKNLDSEPEFYDVSTQALKADTFPAFAINQSDEDYEYLDKAVNVGRSIEVSAGFELKILGVTAEQLDTTFAEATLALWREFKEHPNRLFEIDGVERETNSDADGTFWGATIAITVKFFGNENDPTYENT